MNYKEYTKDIPKTFKSDGCTFAPDGNFRNCCRLHDFARLDPDVPKIKADGMLFHCMWDSGFKGKVLAPFYWLFVRVQGHLGWLGLAAAMSSLAFLFVVYLTGGFDG